MNRDVRRSFRVGDSFDSSREAQPDRARRLIMAAKKPASKKPAAKKAAPKKKTVAKKPAAKVRSRHRREALSVRVPTLFSIGRA